MGKCLEAFREKFFIPANEDFWAICRERYDKMFEKKKALGL